MIPHNPLKYGKLTIEKENELYKNNQKCYYQSHNNLEKENNNSNFKNYNNNVLLKKLFAMSPANQINNNNIIIQNNNININNNFNIRKKVPFVLNFNKKEKNIILENINNSKTTKAKKEIFPIINNIKLNRGDFKLPKLSYVPVKSLTNKEMNEEINDKILIKNSEINIEPEKRILINPIKIIENKKKLKPINSQIRINKLK